MPEDPFVSTAFRAARDVVAPPLSVRRGAALLYEVTVDNRLRVCIDPKAPKRGRSAFQTDLCIFDEVAPDVHIPRVVMEFKTRITTHDVLTYSAKARKHKQIYPYLRYGIVASGESTVSRRFFRPNEALDYCLAVAPFQGEQLHDALAAMLREEVAASRQLERITAGELGACAFRLSVILLDHATATSATVDPERVPAVTLLRAVAELHGRGHQRLRIAPGMSPSGTSWRCTLTPASNTLRANGARVSEWDRLTGHYSTADGGRYFGWDDAQHASPGRLADLFIERYPEIAGASYGEDWAYAGWYQHMLHVIGTELLPIAYADWLDEGGTLAMIGERSGRRVVSLPPPGSADMSILGETEGRAR